MVFDPGKDGKRGQILRGLTRGINIGMEEAWVSIPASRMDVAIGGHIGVQSRVGGHFESIVHLKLDGHICTPIRTGLKILQLFFVAALQYCCSFIAVFR